MQRADLGAVSWCFLYDPATSRGGWDRSGLHGVSVGMNV